MAELPECSVISAMHILRDIAGEGRMRPCGWLLSPDSMRALQLEIGWRRGSRDLMILGLPVRTHDDAEFPVELEVE